MVDPVNGYTIQCIAYASNGVEFDPPCWLQSFDVDAHDGRGAATWVDDRADAMRFDTAAEAFTAWRTQSRVRPLRADGEPNRPLTAFTIAVERHDGG